MRDICTWEVEEEEEEEFGSSCGSGSSKGRKGQERDHGMQAAAAGEAAHVLSKTFLVCWAGKRSLNAVTSSQAWLKETKATASTV